MCTTPMDTNVYYSHGQGILQALYYSTVLNVSHARYSRESWNDPENLERNRSFAVPDENFITVGTVFRLLTYMVSTTETPKHAPWQNLSSHVR
ncbi:hypothetical protein AVEN_112683-1 [Araneus ventricosus]|uniref:Uncharacterized protein n=1 Tax=Araneus ventricosus TaxID=182803 RepID=A0A4Y2VBU4_ARAVE|nr:hypothetical protein AVEN_112683-1 [Araneus ventricosus]